jgi:hypothetical protein
MKNVRSSLLVAAGATVLIAGGVLAQERIINGDNALFGGAPANTAGVPDGWAQSAAGLIPSASPFNSPFNNRYADNSQSWLLEDDAAIGTDGYTQNGYAATAPAKINFDFKVLQINAAGTWGIQFNNTGAPGANLSVIHFRIDDDFYAAPLTAAGTNVVDPSILALTADTWYNVQAILDVPGQTYSGSITPFGGSATNFGGVISNAALNVAGQYVSGTQIRDRAVAQNSPIFIDNVSVNTVPEPTSLGFLALGSVALIRRRK